MEIKYYDSNGNLEVKQIDDLENAVGFLEQLLIDTRELMGKTDVMSMLQPIVAKALAAQDKVYKNFEIIEAVVMASNGDESAGKRLAAMSRTVKEEDDSVDDDEPVQKQPVQRSDKVNRKQPQQRSVLKRKTPVAPASDEDFT